jgi:hypothetical protein
MSQGIVIQGPTTYVEHIVEVYKDLPNVVFSTWEDEPEEKINFLKSNNIEVIQSKKPQNSGYLNVNFQTLSSYAGLEYLKSKGITEGLKIRSDLKPNDIKLLLDILKGKSISFLSICKPDVRPLYYELVYTHTSFDFPSDLLLYGSIDNLINCFNFQSPDDLVVPPESLIAYNYLTNSGIEFKLDYKHFIDNNISFFAQDCLDNNISINWLKRSTQEPIWENILNHSADINLYEY